MSERSFKKLGLALAGGGARGAYQAGVFQALIESGLFAHVRAISGTSIGSLNAILFAHNDLSLAHYLWLSQIEEQAVLYEKNKLTSDLSHWRGLLEQLKSEGMQMQVIKELVTNTKIPLGVFSREGLVRIFSHEINWEVIQNTSIDLYATATNILNQQSQNFHLNHLSVALMQDVLLASSAIPGVFDPVLIEGKQYYDGGIYENLPIDVLYEAGCDLIITIPLFRSLDRVKNITTRYSNAKIIQLMPESSLGGVSGMLDFSPKNTRLLMQKGYEEHYQLIRAISKLFKPTIKNEGIIT